MGERAILPGYAVIDLETGGFGVWEDILEAAVVLLDSNFELESKFTVLFKNTRPVRNSHAHGIDAEQLENAVEAKTALLSILSLMNGRTPVAHNASFERRFIAEHAAKYGVYNLDDVSYVDTAPIAKELTGSRKLTTATAILGISHERAHTALSDAEATADLLRIAHVKKSDALKACLEKSAPFRFAISGLLTLDSIPRLTDEELTAKRSLWLSDVVFGSSNSEIDKALYTSALRRFALNYRLSAQAKQQLAETIETVGVSRALIDSVHESLIASLSNVWFPKEILPERHWMLKRLADDLGSPLPELEENGSGAEILEVGSKIMLSGNLSKPHTYLEKRYGSRAFTLTRKLDQADVLVTAHPDTGNRQTVQAFELGIPVIHEKAFETLLLPPWTTESQRLA